MRAVFSHLSHILFLYGFPFFLLLLHNLGWRFGDSGTSKDPRPRRKNLGSSKRNPELANITWILRRFSFFAPVAFPFPVLVLGKSFWSFEGFFLLLFKISGIYREATDAQFGGGM